MFSRLLPRGRIDMFPNMSSIAEPAPNMALDEHDIILSPDEFVAQMVAHERNAAGLALALRGWRTRASWASMMHSPPAPGCATAAG